MAYTPPAKGAVLSRSGSVRLAMERASSRVPGRVKAALGFFQLFAVIVGNYGVFPSLVTTVSRWFSFANLGVFQLVELGCKLGRVSQVRRRDCRGGHVCAAAHCPSQHPTRATPPCKDVKRCCPSFMAWPLPLALCLSSSPSSGTVCGWSPWALWP
jgi:hypothetical protein